MKPGAMIVDVACDENGAIETCRDTTHDDPIYFVDGVMHYVCGQHPSAFSPDRFRDAGQCHPALSAADGG